MNSRKRTNNPTPALFFVTITFKGWKPLLNTPAARDGFEALLFSVASSHASGLMGYVVMPEHAHILIVCAGGEPQLSRFVQALKSLSARRLFPGRGSVWMERYDYFTVVTERQFVTKLKYVHYNPIRRGLVANPTEWKWSSARFWEEDEPHPVLTKGWEWMEKVADEGVCLAE